MGGRGPGGRSGALALGLALGVALAPVGARAEPPPRALAGTPPAFLPPPHGPLPLGQDLEPPPAPLGLGPGAADHTPGEALAAVGAFAPGLDHRLTPPPPPANLGGRMVVMGGVLLAAVGVAGMFLSPGCETRAPGGRCVVPRGAEPLYPSFLVLGLGATATGAYWMRRDLP